MHTESDITALVDRIGWSENETMLYVNKINDDNKRKTSGLTLNGFHKLVTVENIYHSQPNENITDEKLNDYLSEMLNNVAREILTDVFVTDSRSKNKFTGSVTDVIASGLFDNCIGFCHAVKVLELFTSSVRSNRLEQISKANYSFIMGELKGRSTKEGVLVSKGLLHYCQDARESIKKGIYGYGGSAVICDATNEW